MACLQLVCVLPREYYDADHSLACNTPTPCCLFFQKSLKFTTLIHSLVTRYGPQLKPHVPVLRAAVGRCSTFMVKAVLAALQRLEK